MGVSGVWDDWISSADSIHNEKVEVPDRIHINLDCSLACIVQQLETWNELYWQVGSLV